MSSASVTSSPKPGGAPGSPRPERGADPSANPPGRRVRAGAGRRRCPPPAWCPRPLGDGPLPCRDPGPFSRPPSCVPAPGSPPSSDASRQPEGRFSIQSGITDSAVTFRSSHAASAAGSVVGARPPAGEVLASGGWRPEMLQHPGSSLTAENHPARMPAVQRLRSSGDWAPCAGVSLRDGRETESQLTDLSGSVLRGLRETLSRS
ncbi:leucine-rich repeat extensin-like protein 5 [Hyaena hyaena]|uniref:leucine-rich repeat extensin-like protein 5 n=1 Tax=Hyaena hyaena TaxID=95912 RepID=UPI0019225937|nr:leucine-rich repeat extensin-like protein 5 [Hyaena hyaena]